MAEEDSFVILGTSPLPSLCSDGKSLLNDALDSIDPKTPTEEEPKANTSTPFASLTPVDNTPEQANASTNEGSLPTTLPSEQNSLAASFILGDINAEVLKVNTKLFTWPGPFKISILSAFHYRTACTRNFPVFVRCRPAPRMSSNFRQWWRNTWSWNVCDCIIHVLCYLKTASLF